jgi:hypothetical protein
MSTACYESLAPWYRSVFTHVRTERELYFQPLVVGTRPG